MAAVRSGVYSGWLRHRRTLPVSHSFTYPLFMVLLDIDHIADLMAASPFTSYNGWNWASFHDRDHLGESSRPLRQRLAQDAAQQGLSLPDGPIFLLTHLRYLGYCFNPVSFFYCYDSAGALRLVLAEVNNTFGGSHRYWLEPQESSSASGADLSEAWISGSRVFRATSSKAFYVSPFMPADMRYDFAFTEPGDRLVAHMPTDSPGPSTSQPSADLGWRPPLGELRADDSTQLRVDLDPARFGAPPAQRRLVVSEPGLIAAIWLAVAFDLPIHALIALADARGNRLDRVPGDRARQRSRCDRPGRESAARSTDRVCSWNRHPSTTGTRNSWIPQRDEQPPRPSHPTESARSTDASPPTASCSARTSA